MRKFGFIPLVLAGTVAFAADAATAPRGTAVRGRAPTQTAAPAQAPAATGGAGGGAVAARAAKKSSALFAGDTPKIAASKAAGIEGDPCKEEYWGCMDQFCIIDNDNGARCSCSNDIIKLDKEYNEVVAKVEAEINRASEIETQIEFGGEVEVKKSRRRAAVVDVKDGDEEEECGADDIACKIGAAKYNAAAKLCETLVSPECKSGYSFAKLQYSQNVRNDCNAYQLIIKDAKGKGAEAAAEARKQMRETAAGQFEALNKFNESECRVELRACMSGPDVCGADWKKCAGREIDDFRFHCEKKVLDNCQAVREAVWTGFAGEIAPTLSSIALDNESEKRKGCLTRISNCIVKACQDDIAGTGETMDGCLSRPEMARSFCKIELDECDGQGLMWTFVKQKLGALRVDRCTVEVKECLTRDLACGSDYGQCLGLDLAAIYKMCPLDKLVVCKQDNPKFSLSDVENIVRGIFLQIDNKQLDDCVALVDEKMTEICGSTVNCDKFTDAELGTKSLRYRESDGNHIISGIVNWGGVMVADGSEWAACAAGKNKNCGDLTKAGTLLVDDYVKKMSDVAVDENAAALVTASNESVANELKSVAGEINRIIGMIESDQKIGWCVNGRDLGQVTGQKETTAARFPLLMQTPRRIIAEAGLAKAVANHNVRLQNLIAEAQKKADAKAAAYMCYSKPLTAAGRSVPEFSNGDADGNYGSVKVIGKQGASDAEIMALAGTHTVKIDDILTKDITAAWSPEKMTCRICVVDNFKGKRKYVDPRAGEAEALKKALEELAERKQQYKDDVASGAAKAAGLAAAAALTGVGITVAITAVQVSALAAAGATTVGVVGAATAGATVAIGSSALGTSLAVAGATAAVPVVGWVTAAVIATAAIVATVAIASVKHADPMEDFVDRKVDYCVDEEMGTTD
ncbi:MAG: hypothetical protein LBQ49_00355 [Rickettsiales bacterium]|jgi:hypothetical protein|nr:hypothetical protein [Rickettsiales bacterium]